MIIGVTLLVVVSLPIVLPIYFVVVKRGAQPKQGGDGSQITMEDGSHFTYSNPFGGTCKWPQTLVLSQILTRTIQRGVQS